MPVRHRAAGDDDASPDAVFPKLAGFTRVCAYDRPGTTLGTDQFSRSDPVPMRRSAADAVNDLHQFLGAAGVPAPYVLVGHSTGGLTARLYAASYPEQVVGLVLVDAIATLGGGGEEFPSPLEESTEWDAVCSHDWHRERASGGGPNPAATFGSARNGN